MIKCAREAASCCKRVYMKQRSEWQYDEQMPGYVLPKLHASFQAQYTLSDSTVVLWGVICVKINVQTCKVSKIFGHAIMHY